MYHPTTRLLTILELLQAHPALSGAALARRLEVEKRSVRRYIQMLQDMGMPIEAVPGPGGGYRIFEPRRISVAMRTWWNILPRHRRTGRWKLIFSPHWRSCSRR